MIILDTNVISALMRPELNPNIVLWVDTKMALTLWTTSITIMELHAGLHLLLEGKRRKGLSLALERLLDSSLKGRVLSFDQTAAERAAVVNVAQKRRGQNVEIGDTQIAGIALANQATLATRNIKDFADLDISLVDPWAAWPPT